MKGIAIVDASNLVFSRCQGYFQDTQDQPDLQMIRILTIEELMKQRQKHKKGYDEWVMCFDSRSYWRRDYFEHYKGSRKKARDKDSFDWKAFFPLYEQFKIELQENFPVKCLEVDGAEADDLIATLAKRYAAHRDVLILSSDKDFVQLQLTVNPAIKQWSLFHKKYLTPKGTDYSFITHIIKGDSDDGVPNILSDADTLVTEGKRQKPVKTTWLEECEKIGMASPEKFCTTEDMLAKYKRNIKLIDLREIPDDLSEKIIQDYDSLVPATGKTYNYFVANRLTRLMEGGTF
jgi:hypothetical protein